MSEVLYRKYRPRTFAEVIGQDAIKTILKNAVQTSRVSHAYLFTGPRGTGKTTMARLLAKSVNCVNPTKEGDADGACINCQQIAAGNFLDLFEIDAASYTGVDNIREIIDHVRFAPNTGKYKVFIIDEVHMLSKAAFNALLKTLEEPPAHAIFILATTEIQKVPATIISRTQRFDFKPVSQADILTLFEHIIKDQKVRISSEAQRLVAQAAHGSFRDALSILDQLLSFSKDEITLEQVEDILGLTRFELTTQFIDTLVEKNSAKAITLIKNLTFEGKDIVLFIRSVLEYMRLVFLVKTSVHNATELGLTADDAKTLALHADNFSGSFLLQVVKQLLEAYRSAKTSPVQELPVMTAIYSLCEQTNDNIRESKTKKTEPKPVWEEKTKQSSAYLQKTEHKKTDSEQLAELSFDLGVVVDRWGEVLGKIKEYNHSLVSSLRLGRLVAVKGAELHVAFPYSFHKETIAAHKNRIVVEQVLEEIFEEKMRVKALLEKEIDDDVSKKIEAANDEDLIGEAMKILGDSSTEGGINGAR